jgi:hypothetical protein
MQSLEKSRKPSAPSSGGGGNVLKFARKAPKQTRPVAKATAKRKRA